MLDMLINSYQSLAIRTASLEGRMNDEEAKSEVFISSITDLLTQLGSSSSDNSVAEILSYISTNGLSFGEEWWIGSKGGNFVVSDVGSCGSYTFSQNVTKTL